VSRARERLQAVLDSTGHAAKKSLGQNFLISDVVIDRILQEVAARKPARLIEIGPGPGALTDGLLQMGLPLTAIELDSTMAARWREKGLEVIEADALRIDWAPLTAPERTLLVSNLPYQISSSIVIERSLDDRGVGDMVLMFQKEVAQRIRAAASAPDFGLLSVIAQVFWDVVTITDAGPRDFLPPPKVASRVLAFRARAAGGLDRRAFLGFVKAAFAQRRKLLRSNLRGWMIDHGIPEEKLLAKLAAFGLKETARAEEISPARFLELYGHLDHSRQ